MGWGRAGAWDGGMGEGVHSGPPGTSDSVGADLAVHSGPPGTRGWVGTALAVRSGRSDYSYAAFWYGITPLCFLTKACTVQGKRPPSAHGVGRVRRSRRLRAITLRSPAE